MEVVESGAGVGEVDTSFGNDVVDGIRNSALVVLAASLRPLDRNSPELGGGMRSKELSFGWKGVGAGDGGGGPIIEGMLAVSETSRLAGTKLFCEF